MYSTYVDGRLVKVTHGQHPDAFAVMCFMGVTHQERNSPLSLLVSVV